MRILFANDGLADAGGVHTYLASVMGGLRNRGYQLGFLHCGTPGDREVGAAFKGVPCFGIGGSNAQPLQDVRTFAPDLVFSHNMRFLDVERQLLDAWPVVKFMHGYFGTCIGGQKMFALPAREPCSRRFGEACLACYFPRRCGQISPVRMVSQYRWAWQQHELFGRYSGMVVASEYMRKEYVRNGARPDRIHVNPLFPSDLDDEAGLPKATSPGNRVLFVGRMTKLKGGDLLIRAAAEASRRLGSRLKLIMVGDGPQRVRWEKLAAGLRVAADFTGWVEGNQRRRWLGSADLLAVPSVWPEPFGLVGLEAASFGLPAIAFDVGGISQWLKDGYNGWLISGRRPTAQVLADGLVEALSDQSELASRGLAAVRISRQMSLAAHLDRLETILAGACNISR